MGMQERPKVIFHREVGDVARLKSAWADLPGSNDQPLFFQSWDWLSRVIDVKGGPSSDGWQICIATAWRGDRLLALWPLSLH